MLYIVATPIGNLEDITLRAIRILKEVDMIAAEDTRRTIKLCNHYDIKTKLVSFHEHTGKEKREWLLGELQNGKDIALVSDAGTPLISDPGAVLVTEAAEKGIEITSLPGACAVITAITLSGHGGAFTFVGFLSKKSSERKKTINTIAVSEMPCVVYESPHKLSATLKDLQEVCGQERQVVIAKELTKMHEHVFRGSLEQASSFFEGDIRGEFVIILSGKPNNAEVSDDEIRELLQHYLQQGMTKKDAARAASNKLGIRPNRAYRLSL